MPTEPAATRIAMWTANYKENQNFATFPRGGAVRRSRTAPAGMFPLEILVCSGLDAP
jgi:hypothetical protein